MELNYKLFLLLLKVLEIMKKIIETS